MKDHTSKDLHCLIWELAEQCSTASHWQLNYELRVDLIEEVDPMSIRWETLRGAFPPPGPPPPPPFD
jgi:hypothetical protein